MGSVVEALDHDAGQVRASVSIGILNAIQAVLDFRKVTPVARAVLVVVGQPGIRGAPLRRQLAPIEREQVRHRPQRVHRRDPCGMLSDVEWKAAAARAGRVERASLVEIERDGIDDQPVGRPGGQVEPGSHVDGHALAGRAGQARRFRRRQSHDSTSPVGAPDAVPPVLPGVRRRDDGDEEAHTQQAGMVRARHGAMLARAICPVERS